MHGKQWRNRGSGLIVALGVMAMLAIMATTFITLVRLETRVAGSYANEVRCELLAQGAMAYFKALLREDLDRTWGKYENRDSAVGAVGWSWSGSGGGITVRVPGVNTQEYGTPMSNDFWFNPPYKAWVDWGNLFTGEYDDSGVHQQSFAGGTSYSKGVIARYYYRHKKTRLEFDMWLGRSLAYQDANGRFVNKEHPDRGAAVDFDGDGDATPFPQNQTNQAFLSEERSVSRLYYDSAPFVLFSGESYYFPGEKLTGEHALPNAAYWRWAVKLGVAHGGYLNLNTSGNFDGNDPSYLSNIGGIGLRAERSVDEDLSKRESLHLGRLHWQGFAGDVNHDDGKGFPRFYNEVYYHPRQVSLEKLFKREHFKDVTYPDWDSRGSLDLDRKEARALIAHRMGVDGKVADGSDRYRVGWRRDGATYYKFDTPENPVGDDRYFGANEVIEHGHAAYHPGTSAVADNLKRRTWRDLRPYVTMWSTDTILRGKIWPTEGPPYTDVQGDWRHIDILKRVNINLIGASGPEGLPHEDGELKKEWFKKRLDERNRLYYMLVAGMRFSDTPDAVQKACQFIASLADMVDRDDYETYYRAPDSSGNWALGVERQPVINEVVLFVKKANKPDWILQALRFELYNPMENIPWIPDADEIIDIRDYRIRVDNHVWRLGDLYKYPRTNLQPRGDKVTTIGADGLYGDPDDSSPGKKTWDRYLHIGWSEDVPAEITRNTVVDGLTFELWKPLKGEAADSVAISPGKVETIDGVKCVCVDRTAKLQLIKPAAGRGAFSSKPNFTGMYRRWDPLNALLFKAGASDPRSSVVWCDGKAPNKVAKLGKPNINYPHKYVTTTNTNDYKYMYRRHQERNFKVVDGDLPSIGWLGELIMRNAAQDGPITWVHKKAQEPLIGANCTVFVGRTSTGTERGWKNQLDIRAKFDLFRPFRPVKKWTPLSSACRTENLQMLDIFTVWDPSNDGMDNDGDGAVDEEDSGCQPGDKCGPEVRVFGRVDLNLAPRRVVATPFPDNPWARPSCDGWGGYCYILNSGRMAQRTEGGTGGNRGFWGPVETLGDLVRADKWSYRPGVLLAGGTNPWINGPVALRESGYVSFYSGLRHSDWSSRKEDPKLWIGDDDGDGIFDERDERDMTFTWIANHFTTRSNVFEIDLIIDLCRRPHYPGGGEGPKLPFRTYKTGIEYARKQVLGILDRSTCLRILPDGRCEFNGPVDVRLLRFSDDKRVY